MDLNMYLDDIYSTDINKVGYLEKFYALDNKFIRQLIVLANQSVSQLKILNVVTKNNLVNRGETAQRGVAADMKSVLDICKLTSLSGDKGLPTLQDEIAYYRWSKLGFTGFEDNFWKKKASLLMIDYLLSVCVCYVEVFDTGIKVDKFMATRNRFIAGALANLDNSATQKWLNFLQPLPADYTMNSLRMLKLTPTKDKFKVTQPRSSVDFNKSIKVTPVFFMNIFLEGMSDILQKNIVRFKYIKDNLQERDLITTLSVPILCANYPQEFVQLMLSNCDNKLSRGYIRVPELGISKYDNSGVRALNLSRITSVDIVPDFDKSYIDVDFDSIMYRFKEGLSNIQSTNLLLMLYQQIVQEVPPEGMTMVQLKATIESFVDTQYALGTTTYLKGLHNIMLTYSKFFGNYTGKRVSYTGMNSNFDLGVIH